VKVVVRVVWIEAAGEEEGGRGGGGA
jgi:hypothetical protein